MIKIYSKEISPKIKTIFLEISCQVCEKQLCCSNLAFSLDNDENINEERLIILIGHLLYYDEKCLIEWHENVGRCNNCLKNKLLESLKFFEKEQDFDGIQLKITTIHKCLPRKEKDSQILISLKKNHKNLTGYMDNYFKDKVSEIINPILYNIKNLGEMSIQDFI